MPELSVSPNMLDKTKLFDETNEKSKEEAKKMLAKITQSAQFFHMLVSQDKAQKSDAFTHLGLMESYIAELSKLTGYDGMLLQEKERRHAELRAANEEIRELKTKIGSQVSAESVSAGMSRWENVFRAWYEAAGFHYTTVEMNVYNLVAEFSDELVNTPCTRHIASEEIFKVMCHSVDFITDQPDWDIEHDQFHSNMLDTARNKQNIINLFAQVFPSARVTEFRSRKEHDKYYLRFHAVIPWSDLDRFWAKFEQELKSKPKTEQET